MNLSQDTENVDFFSFSEGQTTASRTSLEMYSSPFEFDFFHSLNILDPKSVQDPVLSHTPLSTYSFAALKYPVNLPSGCQNSPVSSPASVIIEDKTKENTGSEDSKEHTGSEDSKEQTGSEDSK